MNVVETSTSSGQLGLPGVRTANSPGDVIRESNDVTSGIGAGTVSRRAETVPARGNSPGARKLSRREETPPARETCPGGGKLPRGDSFPAPGQFPFSDIGTWHP